MPTSILITGCSSGIGLASAKALKERGYHVFASARKAADVAHLQEQGLNGVLLDVNDTTSMQTALDKILSITHGHLDALFNNAGFLQAGAVEDLTRDMNRKQFETNVFGPMELIKLVLPIMRQQGHGRIIQNSSILGVITKPYYGAYNASKFALEGYTRTLRQELLDTNIYVSLINPGPITSRLRQNALKQYKDSIAASQSGAYQTAYTKMEEDYFMPDASDRNMAQSPQAVVKKLIHALESKRPKVHYYVGAPAQAIAFAKRIVPDGFLDWFLTKV